MFNKEPHVPKYELRLICRYVFKRAPLQGGSLSDGFGAIRGAKALSDKTFGVSGHCGASSEAETPKGWAVRLVEVHDKHLMNLRYY